MSHSTATASTALDHIDEMSMRGAAAEARKALELLLEMGMRVVDGDASALLGVAPALAIAVERLDQVHQELQRRAATLTGRFAAVLAEHTRQRRCSDLRGLDTLAESVSEAQAPDEIGRGIVVAVLILLSNLESDERWYARLAAHGPLAIAA